MIIDCREHPTPERPFAQKLWKPIPILICPSTTLKMGLIHSGRTSPDAGKRWQAADGLSVACCEGDDPKLALRTKVEP